MVQGKIRVTLCLTYLLNNEGYNTCFLTIYFYHGDIILYLQFSIISPCFYRLWPFSKVNDELQNVIENSTNFIKKTTSS